MSPAGPSRPEAGVIVEHIRNGHWLKVCAIDEATGLEAVATGPAHEPGSVERLAVAKLKRILAERR